MCKLTSYQKQVDKYLRDFLGYAHPYYLKKAQNNHLKVYIEGVPDILVTGATPSDSSGFDNFKALVAQKIREKEAEPVEIPEPKPCPQKHAGLRQALVDNLKGKAIKTMKSQLSDLRIKEKDFILHSQNPEDHKIFRGDIASISLKYAIKTLRGKAFITKVEQKEIKNEVLRHMNFALPSTAYYAEMIESQKVAEEMTAEENSKIEVSVCETAPIDSKISSKKKMKAVKAPKIENSPVLAQNKINHQVVDITKDESENIHLDDFKNMKSEESFHGVDIQSENRVEALRALSHDEAMALIADIQLAMELNRESHTRTILEMMKQHGISLEDLKLGLVA